MQRFFNGMCDVAGTAERVKHTMVDYGYTEIPIFRAPLVVIAHPGTSVGNISQAQLQDIFSGQSTNWKALGGKDEEIIVVVPGKDTAAMKNFSQLALKRFDVRYDIMTYRSTMVVQIVSYIPGSISFITKGADARDQSVNILKVDGHVHTDQAYPYFQNFSLVIKGKPDKSVAALVDFMTSDKMKKTLIKNGIAPQVP
jgi:phosphate transport system substrate-binding protein